MKQAEAPAVHRMRGPQDLAALQRTVHCSSPDPERFGAEVRLCSGSGLSICDWRSTALAGRSAGTGSDQDLVVAAVAGGRVEWATAERSWVAEPGSLQVLRPAEPIRWSVGHGSRIVQVRLDAAHLPGRLVNGGPAPGPVAESALSRTTAGALVQLVSLLDAAPSSADRVCRSVHSLALALLEELTPTCPGDDGDLRARIVEHIERNLDDRDLTPPTIAEAFGVSLRWVHSAFNTPEESLARYIRRRRVDAVARTLRDERHAPRLSALALRFGFSGREQLARSFRARYGVTVSTYYGMVLDGVPLPEPAEDRAPSTTAA